MRIALNLLYLIPGVVGGTETYADGLLHGLASEARDEEFVVYLTREAAEWPLPDGARWRRVVCPVNGARRAARYRFEQLVLPALLREHGVDLVHSLGYVAPGRPPCPSVVTVHDLNFRSASHLMPLLRRAALSVFVGRSVRRADAVIAVSEATRRELLAVYHRAPDDVVVIHEAPRRVSVPPADPAAVRARLGITAPYMVAFSSVSPNKNLPRLLAAHARVRAEGRIPHRLVLVGHQPPGVASVDDVVWTGYLPSLEVEALLHGADLLVFPSLYEGFGLPVLEAMRAGVPVAASRIPVLQEVAGEAAAFFDPRAVDDIADTVASLGGDRSRREVLRVRGLARVREFTWERAARETLALYHRVVAPRG